MSRPPVARPGGRTVLRAPALVLALASVAALPAAAQGVRGWTGTTGRLAELRPVVQDTVPFAGAVLQPDGSYLLDGVRSACVPQLYCIRYRSLPVEHAVTVTQDVGFTTWGLGVQGLSATALLRGRARVGGDLDWPRSDDRFDALLAYAELQRPSLRVRLGRQQTLSGLGSYGYDGISVLGDPLPWLRAEAYGGRGLARGLNEPRHEALRGLESFLEDREALLVGALVRVEPVPGSVLTGRYQREIWWDRSALLSERASLDATTPLLAPVRLVGSLDYDFAFGRVGKAHLSAALPLLARNLHLGLTGRRYVPYFELWTVWGFFDPVAYHEVEIEATWSPSPRLDVWARGGWRRYGDTRTSVFLRPLTDDGRRVLAGGRLRRGDDWTLDGEYRMEWGSGGFLSSGDVAARWTGLSRTELALHGTAFQQIDEFRVGEGTALGAGLSAGLEVSARARLSGGASLYRHTSSGRAWAADWNQFRAWTALRLEFGEDPGLRSRRRR